MGNSHRSKDIVLQIKTVTEDSLQEMQKRFPNSRFDLILRDFAAFIQIEQINASISEKLRRTVPSLVLEHFGGDDPSAQSTSLSVRNGDTVDYNGVASMLRELRHVPIIAELRKFCDYERFAPWINKRDGHEDFFISLYDKYPKLFSYMDYSTTVRKLEYALMAGIERSYRSDSIRHHIKFREGIEDKLEGIFDWYDRQSEWWFKENVPAFMPKLNPRGFQLETVTEIVPAGREDYFMPLGGKTIKIGKYSYLYQGAMLSQRDTLGMNAADMDSEELAEIRVLILEEYIGRRHIFPEAVDEVIDLFVTRNGKLPDKLTDDDDFRAYAYRSFYDSSILVDKRNEGIHELLPSEFKDERKDG